MNRIFTFSLLCCSIVIFCFNGFAQKSESQGQHKKHNDCGIYASYRYLPKNNNIPEGWHPIFINHIGRYGASYPKDSTDLHLVLTHLLELQSNANLSIRGRELLTHLNQIHLGINSQWGAITPLGIQQTEEITHRMITQYHDLFFPNKNEPVQIHAISTPSIRSMQTMYHTLQVVGKQVPHALRNSSTNEELIKSINHHTQNLQYLKYLEQKSWYDLLKKESLQWMHPQEWHSQFVIKTGKYSKKYAYEFMMALYRLRSSLSQTPYFKQIDAYFSNLEREHLWMIHNLTSYLNHIGDSRSDHLPMRTSTPLLVDMLTSSDRALRTKETGVFFRFTHAEAMLPFIALMQIPQGNIYQGNWTNLATSWKNYEITPFAANLQWIFFKDENNDIYIKVLLNEKEVELPIQSVHGIYYRWNDFKKFYISHIIRILPTLHASHHLPTIFNANKNERV